MEGCGGRGAVVFVSLQTMEAFSAMRAGSIDSDSLFGLRANRISRRVKQAAQTAGLGDGFSGHSARVGMACDLARVGTELPSLMTPGSGRPGGGGWSGGRGYGDRSWGEMRGSAKRVAADAAAAGQSSLS